MGKNNKNENVHVERLDNTQVRHPILQERFLKTSPTRQILSYIETFGVPYLKKGSGIHIKKKNRGKFREYCGGEVTDKCILKAKKSGNSKLVKRAVFAQNARKWKHKEGGEINNRDVDKSSDKKPKKKLVVKRLINPTGMVNKRPIPGLLTNELVALNTKKNETKK